MIETNDGRTTWNPTPAFGTWTCDCDTEVRGTLHKCPECGLKDTERECEQ